MKLFFAVVLLSVAQATGANIYDFSVLPQGGAIQGVPGSTIGWGYSLTNESTSLWLVTTGLDIGGFQYGTPNLLFDFPAVAPGTTVTAPYDPVNAVGLAELILDSSAPVGFVNSGDFVLNAQWWNGDPLGGGRLQSIAPTASQPYSATVAGSTVPEPATTALIALPLLLLGMVGILRQRRQLDGEA